MSTSPQTEASTLNEETLHGLVGGVLQDLGGAFSVPLVQIGENLGLYQALHESGGATSEQLAESTGLYERYVREWLSAQAASNYITYDAESATFSLTPEQAFVFANPGSPFYLAPAFGSAAAFQQNRPQVEKAFRTGEGVAWGDQTECLSCAVARFFRPGYENHLTQAWLPALTGITERLESGANVADIGCGHGISTLIMAEAFPNSSVHGFDFHERSIEAARKHAAAHDVPNLDFHIQEAKDLPGEYDLITLFDCLHDMGDPVGALKTLRKALNPYAFGELESGGAHVLLRFNDGLCPYIPGAGNRDGPWGAGGRETPSAAHCRRGRVRLVPSRCGDALQSDS